MSFLQQQLASLMKPFTVSHEAVWCRGAPDPWGGGRMGVWALDGDISMALRRRTALPPRAAVWRTCLRR
jgi:hypothetical protein